MQNQKIEQLESKQKEMNERLRAQERYTTNDCVVVWNPPFDPSDGRYALGNSLKSDHLGVDHNEDRIKECHILPGTGGSDLFTSVIVKLNILQSKRLIVFSAN